MIPIGINRPIYNKPGNGISIKKAFKEIKKFSGLKKTENILVPGMPNRIQLVLEIGKHMPNEKFIFLLEGTETSRNQIEAELNKKNIEEYKNNKFLFFMAPEIFMRSRYPHNGNFYISFHKRKVIASKSYLQTAVKCLRKQHSSMSPGFAELLIYNAFMYITMTLNYIKPKAVLLWNKFLPFHSVIDNICKEYGVKTIYCEYGVLPGTYAIENIGQMGESYPAVKYNEFLKLRLSSKDIIRAKEIWDYLYESKLNRKVQPQNAKINDLISKLTPDRPIIFYAGQNDYESGLCPYTDYTQKYHSPIFTSSDDAAIFLADISKKNNWNLIYKKHPAAASFEKMIEYPENLIYIDKIDINDVIDISNVTVTILSTTGYISLIRKKPTLMLGYTQLRGKECCYESFSKDKVEEVLLEALSKGFTQKQQKAFVRHIALLNKYYLFDDFLANKKIQYDKNIEECTCLFN